MYEKLKAEIPNLPEEFPAIDAAHYEREMNGLFRHYIFYQSDIGGREYWTSCCNLHGRLDQKERIQSVRERELLNARHNDWGICPWCGEEILYKCNGKLGKKKSLLEYQPVVILTAKDGDLFARGYWARKKYTQLEAVPEVYLTSVYHFSVKEKKATQYQNSYGKWLGTTMATAYKSKGPHIREPLYDNGTVAYTLMGKDAIRESDFKYCCYKELNKKKPTAYRLVKLLAIASLYPDKVEMLRKSGLEEIVDDLVIQGVKNSAFFNWDAKSYKDAFRISRQELKTAKNLELGTEQLTRYVKFKRAVDLQTIGEISKGLTWLESDFYQICKDNGLHPKQAWKYLKKQTVPAIPGDAPNERKTLICWRDYLRMARELGWTLENETVVFPRNLQYSHDRALEEIKAKRERKREEAEMARLNKLKELEQERKKDLKKRQRKYNIEAGGYFIRVAETGEEILREGKTLEHCVGGYAERHLQGKTTILFLRRCEAPEASLYTIEMQGNRLAQIHGYKNDIAASQNPRDKMAWLLDPWLSWLAEGSKRDKNGEPKIVINREERKIAV